MTVGPAASCIPRQLAPRGRAMSDTRCLLTNMAGGMNTKRGIPLAQRIAPGTSATQPAVAPPIPAPACNITGNADGVVLAWQRDNTGRWQALVAAWIPADQLTQIPTSQQT